MCLSVYSQSINRSVSAGFSVCLSIVSQFNRSVSVCLSIVSQSTDLSLFACLYVYSQSINRPVSVSLCVCLSQSLSQSPPPPPPPPTCKCEGICWVPGPSSRTHVFSSVQFKMVSIRSEKPIMRSIPSLRSFPNVAFETAPVFV